MNILSLTLNPVPNITMADTMLLTSSPMNRVAIPRPGNIHLSFKVCLCIKHLLLYNSWQRFHYMYCKRGYFHWGKISRKCWQDITRGGNFHDSTPISFIKAYGFYFRVGVIFAKKTKARKTRKLPPRENVHVYSIRLYWALMFY